MGTADVSYNVEARVLVLGRTVLSSLTRRNNLHASCLSLLATVMQDGTYNFCVHPVSSRQAKHQRITD